MTQRERKTIAQREAKQLVARLRASNKRAARSGAPIVDEDHYRELERVMTRKLLRTG